MDRNYVAEILLKMAARRSTETQFGWSHPDCEALSEAARIVRGEPPEIQPLVLEAVLSEALSS